MPLTVPQAVPPVSLLKQAQKAIGNKDVATYKAMTLYFLKAVEGLDWERRGSLKDQFYGNATAQLRESLKSSETNSMEQVASAMTRYLKDEKIESIRTNSSTPRLVKDFIDVSRDIEGVVAERKYKRGDVYVGEAKDGVPHGAGTLTTHTGTKVSGVFEKGLIVGHASLVYPDGTAVTADFQSKQDAVNARISCSDGRVYEGEVLPFYFDKRPIPHGKGTLIRANGDKCVGDFKKGELYGQVDIYRATGERYYSGEIRNKKANGEGVWFLSDSGVYRGEFKGGKPYGKGMVTYPNGERYLIEHDETGLISRKPASYAGKRENLPKEALAPKVNDLSAASKKLPIELDTTLFEL